MNFHTVHPATVVWWAQRDTCARCAHARVTLEGRKEQSTVMRCATARVPAGKQPYVYCIDARLPSGPCGPDALRFSPKV